MTFIIIISCLLVSQRQGYGSPFATLLDLVPTPPPDLSSSYLSSQPRPMSVPVYLYSALPRYPSPTPSLHPHPAPSYSHAQTISVYFGPTCRLCYPLPYSSSHTHFSLCPSLSHCTSFSTSFLL